MKPGEWIVYTEDGLWFGYFQNESPSYPTRKAAIDYVSAAAWDTRKTPKLKRRGPGSYIYTPKSMDTGRFDGEYFIERLTSDNLERFKKMYEEAIAEEQKEENENEN